MPLPWSTPASSSGSSASVSGRTWSAGPPLVLAACAVLILAWPRGTAAAIYSCADPSGSVVLRDVPCKQSETAQGGVVGESVWEPKRKRPAEHAAPSSRPVTRQQVAQFIESLDQVFAQRDTAAVLAYFAPDVAFELEYRVPQGLYMANFDKSRYAEMLRELFQPGTPYTHQRENMRIMLSADQTQAEVIGTIHETVLLDGRRLQGTTRSRLTVEWRGARLQVIFVRGPTGFDVDRGPGSLP